MIRLYEFYVDDLFYYIVTEYCEGGDLLKVIFEKGSMKESQTCKIMKQILAGIEYCHERNIVHR